MKFSSEGDTYFLACPAVALCIGSVHKNEMGEIGMKKCHDVYVGYAHQKQKIMRREKKNKRELAVTPEPKIPQKAGKLSRSVRIGQDWHCVKNCITYRFHDYVLL